MAMTSKEVASLFVTALGSLAEEEAVKAGDCLSELGAAELYDALKVGSAALLDTWDVSATL